MTDSATISATHAATGAADRHGNFIWYELLTTDADAAQRFYDAVVGWRAAPFAQSGMDYRILSSATADVAGLMALTDEMKAGGARPGWLGYIAVDDVDQAAEAIRQAGGAIHIPPTDILDVGRFAMVADPQGIVFYVMRGIGPEPSRAFQPMADGHGAWNELVTTDQAAALDFYIGRFGWTKGDVMPMGDMGDYQFIDHGGAMIGAVMNRIDNSNSTENGQPAQWNYYFRVPSIAKAAETIRAQDGTITYGPAEVPGGDYVVNAIDPQGGAFGLVGALN